MSGRNLLLLFGTMLLGVAGGVAVTAQGARQASGVGPSPTSEEHAAALAKGKALFAAAGCISCHNESGDKPLKTGLPLNERGLSTEDIARAVNGRLKGKTEEERRAVTLYIASLMKSKNSDESAQPKR